MACLSRDESFGATRARDVAKRATWGGASQAARLIDGSGAAARAQWWRESQQSHCVRCAVPNPAANSPRRRWLCAVGRTRPFQCSTSRRVLWVGKTPILPHSPPPSTPKPTRQTLHSPSRSAPVPASHYPGLFNPTLAADRQQARSSKAQVSRPTTHSAPPRSLSSSPYAVSRPVRNCRPNPALRSGHRPAPPAAMPPSCAQKGSETRPAHTTCAAFPRAVAPPTA